MVNNKSKSPTLQSLAAPITIGVLTLIALSAVIILALSPANAVNTLSLPDDVKPVAINVGAAAAATVRPTVTAAPRPTRTPTAAPSSTPVARNASATTPSAAPAAEAPAPTAPPVATPEPAPTEAPQPLELEQGTGGSSLGPPPEPTPLLPLAGLTPQRIRIPNLGINAFVEHVGLDRENRMDVPRNIWNVAWYKLGAKPGERGNSAIAGHVDGPNTQAIFWELRKAQPGMRIYVQGDRGEEKVFEVYEVATYPFEQAPLERIFGGSDDAHLNLITCTGNFNNRTLNYDQRFVAYTRLVTNP